MDMCEMVSRGENVPRFNCRIGGLAADLPDGLLPVVAKFAATFPSAGRTMTLFSPKTGIWKERTIGCGHHVQGRGPGWCWSVPMARGSGINWTCAG